MFVAVTSRRRITTTVESFSVSGISVNVGRLAVLPDGQRRKC